MLPLTTARTWVVFQESWWGWFAEWDFWLAICTFALMLCTLALAFYTAKLAKETQRLREDAAKSTEAATKSIILSHRPKVIIRNVVTDKDPLKSPASEPISGSFQVFNSGNTQAKVFVIAHQIWIGETLPMKPPYNTTGGDRHENPMFTLPPGLYHTEAFSLSNKYEFGSDATRYIGLQRGSMDIYLMGEITYQDDLGNQRITRFCRLYDRDRCRFFAVQDADYESAD